MIKSKVCSLICLLPHLVGIKLCDNLKEKPTTFAPPLVCRSGGSVIDREKLHKLVVTEHLYTMMKCYPIISFQESNAPVRLFEYEKHESYALTSSKISLCQQPWQVLDLHTLNSRK